MPYSAAMTDLENKSIVDRVLHVLVCIAKAGQPIGAKRIAAMVGMPLSTVYRHLGALKKWGLIQEHMATGLYEPGATGVLLARGFDQNSYLINQSRDEISALVERTGENPADGPRVPQRQPRHAAGVDGLLQPDPQIRRAAVHC